MTPREPLKKQSILKSQQGYLAVFVALTFQVLFIFFAMIVNVGLLVHDKINLQNSVDLAAFYAAGKQAELLNAIGHSNYQIRQAYKLLAWRVRVLGDMANPGHPLLAPTTRNPNLREQAFNSFYPLVCIQHSWWEFNRALRSTPGGNIQQNFCDTAFDVDLGKPRPSFPNPPPNIAPHLPINQLIRDAMIRMRDLFGKSCTDYGSMNFVMATNWMRAYRGDMQNRVEIIQEFANRLTVSEDEFVDLEGGSVASGARKTLEKNLTAGNSGNVEFKLFNSMGGLQTDQWLNKIAIRPVVYYVDTVKVEGGDVLGCEVKPRPCSQRPEGAGEVPGFGEAVAEKRAEVCREPSSTQPSIHSTVGFEKNPWMMAYVGAEATVQGRRPFAPFGAPVILKARAFAQPFGGRIGPWYRTQWPRSSPRSEGGGFVDPFLPTQTLPGGGTSGVTSGQKNTSIPNYSRFPGDTLGLRSELAVGVIQKEFVGAAAGRLDPSDWDFLSSGTFQSPTEDPLAWSPIPIPGNDQRLGPWVRRYEIAAVAPDLFDMTYYSVEPQFQQNYINRLGAATFQSGGQLRPDLGYRAGNSFYETFNVARQIQTAEGQSGGGARVYDDRSFWIVRKWDQLLTAWVPNTDLENVSLFDYQFPENQFGKCLSTFRADGTQTPGGCSIGGRVGYSVRLIAEDYLNADNVADGGDGTRGPIMNPPPASF